MYSERYPALKQKYNFGNFEVIAETLDNHFKELFNLDVLNHEAKQNHNNGSYVEFFTLIMSHLKDSWTVEEVSEKLYDILHKDEAIRRSFLGYLVFVPKIGNMPSKQLGFLEKMATGELKVAEPVTFLDMLRVTCCLPRIKHKTGHHGITQESLLDNSFAVVNLHSVYSQLADKIKKNKKALMVNFNLNPKEISKWGVIDLRDPSKPQVYCETPLLETEKKELESRLNIKIHEVCPGKSDNLPSTGYTAIAWLDENITRAWNFDPAADFNQSLYDYTVAQFSGDVNGVHFAFAPGEYQSYVTRAVKAIVEARFGGSSDPEVGYGERKLGGFSFIKLAAIASLNNIKGSPIILNDFAKVIQVVGDSVLRSSDFEELVASAYRSKIPCLPYTLKKFNASQVLKTDSNSASLNVPNAINWDQLLKTHIACCAERNTNSKLISHYIPRQAIVDTEKAESSVPGQEDIATTMVLTMFRSFAKKPNLSIDLPSKFKLNADEHRYIVNLMEDNAYVTTFTINDSQSLHKVKSDLLPVFARNRWLAEKGYLPPLVDNYWQRAAKYWLLHLNEQHDLLANKHEHDFFKCCVQEMGLKGLRSVLALLRDESQRDILEGVYGKNKPAFFAACQPQDLGNYIDALINHFQVKAYFPFSEFGMAYQPGYDQQYFKLLTNINQLDRFEQITLTNSFEFPKELSSLLTKLMRKAHEEKWTGLIVIPELENISSADNKYREWRSMYAHLNNIILRNRHLRAKEQIIVSIRNKSNFEEQAKLVTKAANIQASHPTASVTQESIERSLKSMRDKLQGPWPLQRGGAVQLQLQQQQQIEQNRQIQQEQQKMQMRVLDGVFLGELVTYDNIDTLLGDYYKEFKAENPVNESSATLRSSGETLLQGFFHTWINANPSVNASQVIQSMTLDAAKMLLRRHMRLPSGLNLNNLSKGFHLQRAKNGSLVLCYNPEAGFCNNVNPLTLDMQVNAPVPLAWEGDFRLFNVDKYLDSQPILNDDDFQYLALFAKLQPVKNYASEYEAFMRANPDIEDLIVDQVSEVQSKWLIFLQAWQYAGEAGVRQFLELSRNKKLLLKTADALGLLLRNQSEPIKQWIKSGTIDEDVLRALGQVYYQYGDQGLSLLLAKFRQIYDVLGFQFFTRFNNEVICHNKNYACYINEGFFIAMDEMMKELNPEKARGNRAVWLAISKLHLQIVPWENTDTLWRAFTFFIRELKNQDLELKGDEFDQLKPENMLICFDRILETLQRLPDQQQKISFMRRLSSMQLTHGGVHYAIQHEGFLAFDDELKLHDFEQGTPTYAPDLANLYNWSHSMAALNIQRTLASRTKFSQEDRRYLAGELKTNDVKSRHALMLLLYAQYDTKQLTSVLNDIRGLNDNVISLIATHLHYAIFKLGQKELTISLPAIMAISNEAMTSRHFELRHFEAILSRYPHGNMLEAVSILYKSKRWADLQPMMTMFEAKASVGNPKYPEYLLRESYKLAVLFGVYDPQQLEVFFQLTSELKPLAFRELSRLIVYLHSVDYDNSDLSALNSRRNWEGLLNYITSMKSDLARASQHRMTLLNFLTQKGIKFNYSKSGAFRSLRECDEDKPDELNSFVDHKSRLWKFLLAHIAVPVNQDAKESLKPLMRFFKTLELNRTYLNEVEPLLAILEKTKPNQVWTANYFYQLLQTLQPNDATVSYPIAMVSVMVEDVNLSAKPIDEAEKDFPSIVIAPIKAILQNTIFDREQQSILCELALKEYEWQKSIALQGSIIALLSPDHRAASRLGALQILKTSQDFNELGTRLDATRWLLEHAVNGLIDAHWQNTAALWLKAVSAHQREYDLLMQVRASVPDTDAEKRAMILHVIAWSSLHPGLRDEDTFEYELNSKAPKLVASLRAMNDDDLRALAACYPGQPAPSADDILRLIKKAKNNSSWKNVLDEFLRHPYPEPRLDYQDIASTRQVDFQRMLQDTQLTKGGKRTQLSAEAVIKLSFIFAELKQLEAGEAFVYGANKPIAAMNKDELARAFQLVTKESEKNPQNSVLAAQVWALLFEALGRTTRKYPHLAQQFALIANDVCIDSKTRILQLSTGEGKSHFVALRAAKHAGRGKVVDVCTAKRSLAIRDLKDYKELFNYLGLTSTYLHAKSSHETYTDSQIHYTTTGDLSLFMDEQSFNGTPIVIDPEERVGLGDEIDFILFDEGWKTEYNYARPTGKTPKQMTWFYQAVNAFYIAKYPEAILSNKVAHIITVDTIVELANMMLKEAGDDEERQQLVQQMIEDPLQFVRWTQSAHETQTLKKGVGYTVREEHIKVGETIYPMKEIIPLSTDNQMMPGSTFSEGVQQLLAVWLNTEAKKDDKPQNVHVHPESHIISSQVAAQRMKTMWGTWEGFTGTISTAQADILDKEQKTQVLHVPTNQRDLRVWHKPTFYRNEEDRLKAFVELIRHFEKQKKSILFPCKNDAQVSELKLKLESHLIDEERNNFIFYTNEDAQSPSEILEQKRQQENWQGGKKQKQVCLGASGFGRGDNVGVEVVSLFNANGINDQLQKGGRTARNGEEGEVFQFYLIEELQKEEKQLLHTVSTYSGATVDKIRQDMNVEGESEEEKCLNRVMLLGEYVFNLQNAANQGYHAGLAQFSGWTMCLIGLITDPSQRTELIKQITIAMKVLGKKWIEISSDSKLTPIEQVRQIEKEIQSIAEGLQRANDQLFKNITIPGFILKEYPDIQLTIKSYEKKLDVDEVTQCLAQIGGVLANLNVNDADTALMVKIIDMLNQVKTNSTVLARFAERVADCKSIKDFVSGLNLALEQLQTIEKTDSYVAKLKKKNIVKSDPESLLDGLDSREKDSFIKAIDGLRGGIAEVFTRSLCEISNLTVKSRVQRALPLMRYVATFTIEQQITWGMEYARHMSQLFQASTLEQLSIQLSGRPMSYDHITSLWRLAKDYATETALPVVWQNVLSAVVVSPEKRLRMFTKWEGLAKGMVVQQSSAFLLDFAKVMAQFVEGKNWDIFSKLVDKTEKKWQQYQDELLILWRQLAVHAEHLPELRNVLTTGLQLQGKLWVKLLTIYTSLPVDKQIIHQSLFVMLLEQAAKDKGKQREVVSNFILMANVLAQATGPVSKERMSWAMSTNQDSRILPELVEYHVRVPKALADNNQFRGREESCSRDILNQLISSGFFNDVAVLEVRKRCMSTLNAVIAKLNPANSDQFQEQVQTLLRHYKSYLMAIAEKRRVHRSEGINFDVAAEWYLNFVNQYPNGSIHVNDMLSQNPQLKLKTLVSELREGRFDEKQIYLLLSAAKEFKTTSDGFIIICRGLDIFNTTLADLDASRKNILQGKLLALSSDKLICALKLINDHKEDIQKTPKILEMLLDYAAAPRLAVSRVEHLFLILIKVAGLRKYSPDQLAHLNKGIARFMAPNRTDQDLVKLLELLDTPHAEPEQLLFDNVAHYLHVNVSNGNRNAAKGIIDYFYQRANQTNGNPEKIFNLVEEAKLKTMFDFTSNSSAAREERVTWMHLLNHQAFVTGSTHDSMLDNHTFQWCMKQNEDLLQLGFDRYMAHAAKILETKPKGSVSLVRDLNVGQQRELLQLSDEISIIGRPTLDKAKDTETNVAKMKQDFSKILHNYQSSFFKSSIRNRDFVSLQNDIERVVNVHRYTSRPTSRYMEMYKEISSARLQAMTNDLEQERRGKKLHMSGHSRYFSTLNQLQDMVLRHWTQDMNAVHDFDAYKMLNKEDFVQLTVKLRDALKLQRNNDASEMGRFSAKFGQKKRQAIVTTLSVIESFTDRYGSSLYVDMGPIADHEVKKVLSAIREASPNLPGYVQAFATEVLTRGDAFAMHLDTEKNDPLKRVLLNN